MSISGEKVAPLRAERERENGSERSFEPRDTASVPNVPDSGALVGAAGGDVLAAGTEDRGIDLGVMLEKSCLLSARCIPDPCGLVRSCRHDLTAVRADRDRGDRTGVPVQTRAPDRQHG